jgi:hypothetical protein
MKQKPIEKRHLECPKKIREIKLHMQEALVPNRGGRNSDFTTNSVSRAFHIHKRTNLLEGTVVTVQPHLTAENYSVILIFCELVKLKNMVSLVREILSYRIIIRIKPLHS